MSFDFDQFFGTGKKKKPDNIFELGDDLLGGISTKKKRKRKQGGFDEILGLAGIGGQPFAGFGVISPTQDFSTPIKRKRRSRQAELLGVRDDTTIFGLQNFGNAVGKSEAFLQSDEITGKLSSDAKRLKGALSGRKIGKFALDSKGQPVLDKDGKPIKSTDSLDTVFLGRSLRPKTKERLKKIRTNIGLKKSIRTGGVSNAPSSFLIPETKAKRISKSPTKPPVPKRQGFGGTPFNQDIILQPETVERIKQEEDARTINVVKDVIKRKKTKLIKTKAKDALNKSQVRIDGVGFDIVVQEDNDKDDDRSGIFVKSKEPIGSKLIVKNILDKHDEEIEKEFIEKRNKFGIDKSPASIQSFNIAKKAKEREEERKRRGKINIEGIQTDFFKKQDEDTRKPVTFGDIDDDKDDDSGTGGIRPPKSDGGDTGGTSLSFTTNQKDFIKDNIQHQIDSAEEITDDEIKTRQNVIRKMDTDEKLNEKELDAITELEDFSFDLAKDDRDAQRIVKKVKKAKSKTASFITEEEKEKQQKELSVRFSDFDNRNDEITKNILKARRDELEEERNRMEQEKKDKIKEIITKNKFDLDSEGNKKEDFIFPAGELRAKRTPEFTEFVKKQGIQKARITREKKKLTEEEKDRLGIIDDFGDITEQAGRSDIGLGQERKVSDIDFTQRTDGKDGRKTIIDRRKAGTTGIESLDVAEKLQKGGKPNAPKIPLSDPELDDDIRESVRSGEITDEKIERDIQKAKDPDNSDSASRRAVKTLETLKEETQEAKEQLDEEKPEIEEQPKEDENGQTN